MSKQISPDTKKAQMLDLRENAFTVWQPPFFLSLWERLIGDHLMLISPTTCWLQEQALSHSKGGGPTTDELCLQSLGYLHSPSEWEGISRSLISGSP